MNEIIHAEPTPTLDEVWRLLIETTLLLREEIRETRQLLKEEAAITSRLLKEDAQETRRMLQELAQESERRSQEADRRSQEADRRSQEADRRLQETERMFKEQAQITDKKLGELGNRLGEFVEGFVAPAAVRLFQERNITVQGLNRDMERNDPALDLATQIDLLVLNGDTCVVIEVRSRLSVDDVNEHLERMKKFKLLFPEYVNKQAYGAVAAMVIPSEVGRYAYRKGLFVIGQTGDAVKILNDEKFKPITW